MYEVSLNNNQVFLNFNSIIYLTISTIISSGIILFVIKKYLENRLNYNFQEKIEKYKNQLSIINELSKFDYQRKLTDYKLFTEFKHTIYRQIFSKIILTYAHCFRPFGLKEYPNFQNYTLKEVIDQIKSLNVLDELIIFINSNWDKNKHDCIKKIRKVYDFKDAEESRKCQIEAKNYFYENILYVSNDIEKLIKEVLSKIIEINIIWETCEDFSNVSEEELKKIREYEKELQELIYNKLKTLMNKELAVGYYDFDLTNSKEVSSE